MFPSTGTMYPASQNPYPVAGWGFLLKKAAAILLVISCSNAASAASHTPEELLKPGDVRAIAISPDGNHVAIGLRETADRAESIAVVEIDPQGEPGATRRIELGGGGTVLRILSLRWVNNVRLFAEITSELKERPQLVRTAYGMYVRVLYPSQVSSIDAVGGGSAVPLDLKFRAGEIADDPSPTADTVVMRAFDDGVANLYRVNVNTAAAELIERGNDFTCCWSVRNGRPMLRVDTMPYRNVSNVYTRSDEANAPWVHLSMLDSDEQRWVARHYLAEAKAATGTYVLAPRDGADTADVQLYDLATKTIVSTPAEVPGHDIDSALVVRGELVAANYVDDRLRQVVADPVLGAHYLGLQEYFGQDKSVEIVGIDDSHNRLLLHVTGPQLPGEYHIYDVGHRHAELVITERPWIDPARLATVTVRRVTTRDGAVISAYLTCPSSTDGKRPALIVMPPAGPWTRSAIRFNPVAQAFASQGWCVLESNYRGVRGYGRKFQRAGFGEWSGRVAQDIVDSVNDVVAAGIVDRRRIAIYGDSIGAYAALAGAIDNPDLYRAAVVRSVLSDFDAMVNGLRMTYAKHSEIVDRWSGYRGDETRRNSPVMRASGIRCPVMLIHATGGQEIPIEQSKALQKALEKAGRPSSTLWLSFDGSWVAEEHNELLQVQGAIGFLQLHF